jgi:hypothetical protein
MIRLIDLRTMSEILFLLLFLSRSLHVLRNFTKDFRFLFFVRSVPFCLSFLGRSSS